MAFSPRLRDKSWGGKDWEYSWAQYYYEDIVLIYSNCSIPYIVILTVYFIHSSALPPSITISSTGTLTAGKPLSFICTVTLEDGGSLAEDLAVQWVTPVDISIRTDSHIRIMITNSTVARTSELKFTPLRTSHGGLYTCKATTTAGMDTTTETLTVQSEKR